jgi:hypothetical protein
MAAAAAVVVVVVVVVMVSEAWGCAGVAHILAQSRAPPPPSVIV